MPPGRTLPILTLLTLASTAPASPVSADFNDNTVGQLSHATPGSGQAGGTGFNPDPNNTWGDTGTIDAIAGDLTAPPHTNYSITQSGAAVSAQGDFDDIFLGRQSTRVLATTLSGDVWFSFLLNQPTANSRGGITFNQNGFATGDPRIVAIGRDLRLGLAELQSPSAGANNIFTLGQTALVLGRLTIDPLGDETLAVWVDPDVSLGPGNLPAPDTSLTQQAFKLDAGITRLGIQSYSSDNIGGIIDSLRLSDGPGAFAFVTSGDNQTTPPAFAITAVRHDPTTSLLSLTWNAHPGTTYTIESSTDLKTWQGIDTLVATSTSQSHEVSPPPSSAINYRIQESR